MIEKTPLHDACREVFDDAEVRAKYPKGMTGADVLTEIRLKEPGAFPLISVLDVIDCMNEMYGRGSRA